MHAYPLDANGKSTMPAAERFIKQFTSESGSVITPGQKAFQAFKIGLNVAAIPFITVAFIAIAAVVVFRAKLFSTPTK